MAEPWAGVWPAEGKLWLTDRCKVFCGTANTALADSICAYLGVPRGRAEHGHFSDGGIALSDS